MYRYEAVVGVAGEHPVRLRRFHGNDPEVVEDAAAQFITPLEGAEDGKYYLDLIDHDNPEEDVQV